MLHQRRKDRGDEGGGEEKEEEEEDTGWRENRNDTQDYEEKRERRGGESEKGGGGGEGAAGRPGSDYIIARQDLKQGLRKKREETPRSCKSKLYSENANMKPDHKHQRR